MTKKDVSTCSVEGCEKPRKAHTLCNAHNERRRLGKDLEGPLRPYEFGGVCKVEGCEKVRTDSADYCRTHRMRLKRQGEIGTADLQKARPGEAVWNTREYRRRYSHLKDYGLTPEDYESMLARQRGACAACGTTDSKTGRVDTWCIDHDHVTGQVRGLLCATCNRGIGMLKDDPDVLKTAAAYILHHRQMILFGPAGKVSS